MANEIIRPDEGVLISSFPRMDINEINGNDLLTGLHNGANWNFRVVDLISHIVEGIDLNPGVPPSWDPVSPLGDYVTYSVLIDHSKSDPYRMCEYADDALHLRGTWASAKDKPIFKKLRCCVLRDGEVQYYLDPNDLTKKEDGTARELQIFKDDVMLEFPERLGYRFEWVDKNILKVSVTNRPAAAGFCYDAFSFQSENDCDKVYLGRYRSWAYNSMAWSYPNTDYQLTTQSYANWLTYCHARGAGYELQTWGARTLWACLYLIVHKNLNGQNAVGYGFVSGSGYSGGADKNGFDGELATQSKVSSSHIACLGLENPWGYYEYVFGLRTDANKNALVYNWGSGDEWLNAGSLNITNGWIRKPAGTNKLGFAPATTGGSDSTYYCDYGYVYASAFGMVGSTGGGSNGYAGPFAFYTGTTGSGAARLMYFHRA